MSELERTGTGGFSSGASDRKRIGRMSERFQRAFGRLGQSLEGSQELPGAAVSCIRDPFLSTSSFFGSKFA